ncbi:MAG: hypothetical protein Q4D78_03565 [Neisseria zoodegmatis]|uniref:hypothetical protein n=1 Tax=Neisseria zoodegmatis TaxID=326523 RepID=UPI0026F28697|nr:hypothetical protein [Neisseria zoodegmatis]MDO5069264.1 hypothetical protein [Neisseria zoodegmatis]
MTVGQFIFGSLVVYAIIHLHRKHGFKWFREQFFLAIIGIFIGTVLAVLLFYLIFVVFA